MMKILILGVLLPAFSYAFVPFMTPNYSIWPTNNNAVQTVQSRQDIFGGIIRKKTQFLSNDISALRNSNTMLRMLIDRNNITQANELMRLRALAEANKAAIEANAKAIEANKALIPTGK